MLLLWLTWQDWDCKPDWKFNIICWDTPWNNVGLFSFDHTFDPLQSLWWVQQDLREREMIWELFNILRHYEVHSLRGSFHVTDFKNFHIVPKDIRRHLEWWNVNHIHIWVFRCKDSTNLRVFPLQKFVHRNSFHLFNRKRVDMHFDTSSLLDCRPLLPEFFHHLLPYEQRFTG